MKKIILFIIVLNLQGIIFAQNTNLTQQLLDLCRKDATLTLDAVKALVEKGANVNGRQTKQDSWDYNMTPTHGAALWVKLDILQYLKSKGADMNSVAVTPENYKGDAKFNGCTPFAMAIFHYIGDRSTPEYAEYADKRQTLLDFLANQPNFNPNQRLANDFNLLMFALASEYTGLPAIEYLIKKGVDVNAQTKKKSVRDMQKTPLWFCNKNKIKEARLLIANGAKKTGDRGIYTVFAYLIMEKQNTLARIFLEHNIVDINEKMPEVTEVTHLNIAVNYDNIEMVEYLLQRGQDPKEKTKGDRDAFYYAKDLKNPKMKTLLTTKKLTKADSHFFELMRSEEYAKVDMKLMSETYNFNLSAPLKGKNINLEQYKGKVVLVTFWATWCVFCIKEFPSIQKMQTEIGEENVKVIAITRDKKEDLPKVDKFVEKHTEWQFDYALHNAESLKNYSTTIPGAFILDKSGKIVVEIQGAIDWAEPRYIKLFKAIGNL